MKRIYLDHSATTPVAPEVFEAMTPYLQELFGNPSSIHSFGREIKKELEEARAKIAALIGAEPAEIIFTSGGTEADNMAIMGVVYANKAKGNHIITSAIEHHAVLDTCKYLEKNGFKVTYLPVDEYGMISVKAVEEAITPETTLITIMHANNEVGTIQPISEIGEICKVKKIFFHTDAIQSVGKIPVDVNKLNVDLLALAGHKIYGPKGVGALYIRKGTRIAPIAFGGSQEKKRRPGTENIPGIIGLGKAAELAQAGLAEEMGRLTNLRDKLHEGILSRINHVKFNGHPTERLPSHVNMSFKFIEGESLLLSLDLKGIAASSGSACTSGSLDPSHVLLAMGLSHEIAHGSLRITLGKHNTEEDINYVLETLPEIIDKLRAMSPLYQKEEGVV